MRCCTWSGFKYFSSANAPAYYNCVFSGLEPDTKSFYRPHKIALWNNLIPDLVRLNIPDEEKPEAEKPETGNRNFPKFSEPASPGFAASPPHQDLGDIRCQCYKTFYGRML
jgi:hypothetical protein